MYREDTIAAIATPPGEGAVAIVRISGIDAEAIGLRIFARTAGKGDRLDSHKLYLGRIRDPHDSRTLDDVLLTVMRRPRSYTGEDVVEIHCHGGSFVVRQVLGLVLREGARQADPGEFTKRAFLNGRLDLTQAEAVRDLIRARTDKAAGLAVEHASGALARWVSHLREELLAILVQVEAAIDFPEEEIELLQRRELAEKTAGLATEIEAISKTYEWGRLFRDGAQVCICGRPNVGKSSLLNALLGEERVLVTPVPGTTRDVIEEGINLDGLPVVLWDTAGIRDSQDEIERAGVALTRQYANRADAIVLVLDGSTAISQEDRVLLAATAGKRVLVAVNKSDLANRLDPRELRHNGKLEYISAKTGERIPELKRSIRELLLGGEMNEPVVIANERHRSALAQSKTSLSLATNSLIDGLPPEFVAVDLDEARKALEEITGLIQNEDILERIFNDFCIGK